jgi:hypothetical protein
MFMYFQYSLFYKLKYVFATYYCTTENARNIFINSYKMLDPLMINFSLV